MTFIQYEESLEGSRPIEIIRFFLGSETFEYTSAEDDITVASVLYSAEPIKRSKISQSPEDRDRIVSFEVSGDNKFATRFIGIIPGKRARVTVQRLQRPDFPGPEVVTLYDGFVASVKFSNDGYTATIASQSIAAAASRPIPRFTYQGMCNHVLYDDGCKVDDTDSAFRLTGNVLTSVNNTITVSGVDGEADGFYDSGFVEEANGDVRLILEHTGTSLLLLLPFPFSVLGTQVTVLAGCDHTIAICGSKFFTPEVPTSNVINYGGFAFIPTKNIFQTGIS